MVGDRAETQDELGWFSPTRAGLIPSQFLAPSQTDRSLSTLRRPSFTTLSLCEYSLGSTEQVSPTLTTCPRPRLSRFEVRSPAVSADPLSAI